MTEYIIKYKSENFVISDFNVCNNDEVENIDKDILEQSIADNRIKNESEIKSFANGCDAIPAYYSSQNAKEEFESYLMLENSKKIDEFTIIVE